MINKLRIISIVTISLVLFGVGSYAAFALKSNYDVKKQRLEQLKTEYKNQQRKVESEIASMPRNSEEDWSKIKEAENKLKEMPMPPEANQLIQELAPTAAEKARKDLETRIFYSKDILETQSIYDDLSKQEKDPVAKAQHEKSAKIMEQRKALLNQVEKEFKEGKVTYEELNKRIDELMAIDPCQIFSVSNKLIFNGQIITYSFENTDTLISEEENFFMLHRALEFIQALSINDYQKIKNLCTSELYEQIGVKLTDNNLLPYSARTAARIAGSKKVAYGYINHTMKTNEDFLVGVRLELDNDSLYLGVSFILKDEEYLINSLSANR